QNPSVINVSRRQRLAKGSGTNIQDVNRLIKQFEQMRQMMKSVSSVKNPMKMMGQLNQMKKMQGKR
ncbi:MAG: signal recognition particle protein, partial [Muribaculaceae bacterium]|nr:signal recognition particle protein [Muribaculaceae bacterium]